MIIKILITAYSEGGFINAKNNMNNHFLTFHSMLFIYPETISLIDLIEENSQSKLVRFNRLIRDLFNQDP